MHPSPSAYEVHGARVRPPRVPSVVRDPAPEEIGARIDWSSWYLTDEDDMGEGCEQHEIIETLSSSAKELARERGWTNVLLGADAFFAWMKEEPNVRVSPDFYLLDDPPRPPLPSMWQTWLPGHRPPRLAVEIVSGDWEKDYLENPQKYALLGTAELVIFDPDAVTGVAPARQKRVAFQVYRREADGAFVRVHSGDGPAFCAELGAFLVAVREGPAARLRIARDAEGKDVVPTAAEAREAEAKARQAAERDLAEQTKARETAERELCAMRAEIERLRRG
jgi:Uma2 family endonuclease